MPYADMEKKRANRAKRFQKIYASEDATTKSPNPMGWRRSSGFHSFAPRAEQTEYCQHISYVNGALRMCEEPTGGKTYCPSCAMHLITLTDRAKPAEAPQPERADWRAQGPTRDKRKRKAA